MQRLAPDQLTALTAFVGNDWASNSNPAGGAALLVRFGVPKAAAAGVYESARAAYQSGFLSTASDAVRADREPPADQTLAAVWRAGRAAAAARRKSRAQAVWVGAGLAVAAAVTLTVLVLR
jgi:hypothetical protein